MREARTLEDDFGYILILQMVLMNVFLCVFNLFVPCWPLDSGRIIASFLMLRGRDTNYVATVLLRTSAAVIITLVLFIIISFAVDGMEASGIFPAVLVIALLGMQSHKLHELQQSGQLHQYPLFGMPSAEEQQRHQRQQEAQANAGAPAPAPAPAAPCVCCGPLALFGSMVLSGMTVAKYC